MAMSKSPAPASQQREENAIRLTAQALQTNMLIIAYEHDGEVHTASPLTPTQQTGLLETAKQHIKATPWTTKPTGKPDIAPKP